MTTIRCATLFDTLEVSKFLIAQRHLLNYSTDIDIDADRAINTVANLIVSPLSFFYLSEKNGAIRGVMAATLTPIWWSKFDAANDVFLCVADDAKGDGVNLIRRFIKWAKGFDSVRRIVLSNSVGDERTDLLFTALGFEKKGAFYVMEISQ